MMLTREIIIVNLLADAYNEFTKLPVQKDSDGKDFCDGIHVLQRLVMCRDARRQHPEIFNCKDGL